MVIEVREKERGENQILAWFSLLYLSRCLQLLAILSSYSYAGSFIYSHFDLHLLYLVVYFLVLGCSPEYVSIMVPMRVKRILWLYYIIYENIPEYKSIEEY